MKKTLIAAVAIAAVAACSIPAYAETAGTQSSDQVIRHQSNAYASNVPNEPIWKNREFWHNEKERSGLPQFWDNTKNFFRKLNPAPFFRDQRAKYEANRTAAAARDVDARVSDRQAADRNASDRSIRTGSSASSDASRSSTTADASNPYTK